VPNPSELFSAYAITLDADRASSAASNHALQLAATDLEYQVTRVKSPVIGRDLNPMGRGDGTYYCNGASVIDGTYVAVRHAKPSFVGTISGGYGSSINNGDDDGAGDEGAVDSTADCSARQEEIQSQIDGLQELAARIRQEMKKLKEQIEDVEDELALIEGEIDRITQWMITAIGLLAAVFALCCRLCILFAGPALHVCILACTIAFVVAAAVIIAIWMVKVLQLGRQKVQALRKLHALENRLDELNEALARIYDQITDLLQELFETQKACNLEPKEPEVMPAKPPESPGTIVAATAEKCCEDNPRRRRWNAA
jgi:prefoldin subunit 5